MSEEKTAPKTVSLIQLQEAWQKRPNQLVGKKGWADDSGYWEDDVAKWFEEFGVLLQRLITELPQQAKMLSDWVSQNAKLFNDGKYKDSTELGMKKLVPLEALIPTEKKRLEPQ